MEISLKHIKTVVATFLHRYHVVIFAVVVLGSLVIVVLLLNNIINRSGDSGGYTSATNATSFDQQTIDQIKQLKTLDEPGPKINFSGGRTNPFVE